MAATQSRVVECHTRDCARRGAQQTVWAALVPPGLYDWPRVTCTGCGAEPADVTGEDSPGAVDSR